MPKKLIQTDRPDTSASPLLQIKCEYEKNLSYLREQIRELEPLKAMLVTVTERCNQKIQEIHRQVHSELLSVSSKSPSTECVFFVRLKHQFAV